MHRLRWFAGCDPRRSWWVVSECGIVLTADYLGRNGNRHGYVRCAKRGVTAGGEAETRLEMPGHVALIGEASSVGGVSERDAAGNLGLHPIEATAD